MLEYDRIDISEGIDIKKCKETSSLCKFYYFLDKNFKYEPYLCDGCYIIMLLFHYVYENVKYAKFSYY